VQGWGSGEFGKEVGSNVMDAAFALDIKVYNRAWDSRWVVKDQ
jgi:hypothetical protein